MMRRIGTVVLAGLLTACAGQPSTQLRGTGDLGIVIERAAGSVQIVEHSHNTTLARVEGLGDLSHASLVFSRDARFAYVFGRDAGCSGQKLTTALSEGASVLAVRSAKMAV